jgi:hypothetical protein
MEIARISFTHVRYASPASCDMHVYGTAALFSES